MKVTITDKGYGFVTARFDAESNIETLILSTVAPVSGRTGVSIDSPRQYDDTKPPASHVTFSSFTVPTHELMDKKAP